MKLGTKRSIYAIYLVKIVKRINYSYLHNYNNAISL